MKRLIYVAICTFVGLCLSACVTQKSYQALEAQKKYYESEATFADSLRTDNELLGEKYRLSEAQLRKNLQDMEGYIVANQSLTETYQDLLERYNLLVEQSRTVLSTSSYEKLGLQEQLAAQQEELDRKARDLAVMEYQLNERENRLSAVEGSYNTLEGNLAERNRRIRELETLLEANQSKIKNLRGRVDDALRGFTATDLTVEEKNGKLYVSLSQNLLFRSGSNVLDPRGRQALQRLAETLNRNTDIDILVEGHTDSDGSAEQNWDLSVTRATSVVKALAGFGVDSKRMTAAGRALYAPIASNSTAAGKARNRRTEIILSPKLDQLYQLIDP